MRVELHDDARAELESAAHYYDGEVPGLGSRFLGQMSDSVERILSSPKIGSPERKDLRKLVSAGPFHYSVIYAVRGEVIFVVAFASHYKRYGYWRARVAAQQTHAARRDS
jgi:plasmid stabilization system protein ParE